MLYAHIACSPFRPVLWGRGLHATLLSSKSHTALRELYSDQFRLAAVKHGVEIGDFYHLPWGREYGLYWTSMMSVSKRRADADPQWSWMTPSLLDAIKGREDRTIVYSGGTPAQSLEVMGLSEWPTRLAFDASARQNNTSLIRGLRDGDLVEANLIRPDRSPCIAMYDKWGKKDGYTFSDAPEGSLCWFRNGVNTDAEWTAAKRANAADLDLVVNLLVTKDRERLFSMLGGPA